MPSKEFLQATLRPQGARGGKVTTRVPRKDRLPRHPVWQGAGAVSHYRPPPRAARRGSGVTTVAHVNPEGLLRSNAFTQAVVIDGPHRVVYIGGQNGVDASGNVVGRGDIRAQTEQIFRNLRRILQACGADLDHVVKWNIYVVQGQSVQAGYEVFLREWGTRPNPPAISVLVVAGLAHPDFLVEIDAVAVVPH